MNKILLSIGILIASAGIALADIGAGLVGNTVILTEPDGEEIRIFYVDTENIVLKLPDGAEVPGTWRVVDDTICTTAGSEAETCSTPISEPPAVGSSGTLEAEEGAVAWAVTAGKDF